MLCCDVAISRINSQISFSSSLKANCILLFSVLHCSTLTAWCSNLRVVLFQMAHCCFALTGSDYVYLFIYFFYNHLPFFFDYFNCELQTDAAHGDDGDASPNKLSAEHSINAGITCFAVASGC